MSSGMVLKGLLAFMLGFSLQAAEPPSGEPDARTPIPISRDQAVYEAESLPLDGALATEMGQAGKSVVSSARIPDMRSDRPNGMRLFQFVLDPGEELKVGLDAKGEMLLMRFLRPATETPLASAIQRANLAPTALRRKKISIANVSDAPQEVMLMLTGNCGYAYRMEFQRLKRSVGR